MRRFACFEAVEEFLMRKLECQEVQSASPMRDAFDGAVRLDCTLPAL
jgi:hypothetical protein